MNRPDYDDYEDGVYEEAYRIYLRDLEKYCDYLEEIVEDNKFAWKDLRKDYLSLEKAFYKACSRLEDFDINTYYFLKKVGKEYKVKSSENWKEWCLKDGN